MFCENTLFTHPYLRVLTFFLCFNPIVENSIINISTTKILSARAIIAHSLNFTRITNTIIPRINIIRHVIKVLLISIVDNLNLIS